VPSAGEGDGGALERRVRLVQTMVQGLAMRMPADAWSAVQIAKAGNDEPLLAQATLEARGMATARAIRLFPRCWLMYACDPARCSMECSGGGRLRRGAAAGGGRANYGAIGRAPGCPRMLRLAGGMVAR
jgi:hypothetical protein